MGSYEIPTPICARKAHQADLAHNVLYLGSTKISGHPNGKVNLLIIVGDGCFVFGGLRQHL